MEIIPATFVGILGAAGPLAMVVALITLGLLSRRLGEVQKMPAYYRLFFVGAALAGLALVARVWWVSLPAAGQEPLRAPWLRWVYFLTHDLAMAVGLTLGVAAAWRYWSRLLGERS